MRRPPLAMGTARVSTLILIGAALKTTLSLVVLALTWRQTVAPWLSLLAWVLLASTLVGALFVARRQAERLTARQGGAVVAIVAAALVLDGLLSFGGPAPGLGSLAVTAGTALVLCAAYRPGREALAAAAVIVAAIIAALSFTDGAERSWPETARTLVVVLLPALALGLPLRRYSRAAERGYRSLAEESTPGRSRRESGRQRRRRERAAASGGAEDPHTGATLDLLDGVASGRIALPLGASAGARAGALAASIRARYEEPPSWLSALVAENPRLAGRVELDDPLAFAERIDRGRRATLTAVLLILVGRRQRDRPLRLRLDAAPAEGANPAGVLRIRLDAEHHGRFGDPALWPLLRQLGTARRRTEGAFLALDVDILLTPGSAVSAPR